MDAMTCERIVGSYLGTLGSRFSCHWSAERLWVVSPYSYPDGDLLEVTISELPFGEVRVSDLGETMRHLAGHGFNPTSTPKGEYLLGEIIKQHQVQLDRGMIMKRVPAEQLGPAIQNVLMASLAASHLLVLARGSRPATFVEEVTHLLTEEQMSFEPRHKEIGRSGTIYEFDFLVHGRTREGLIVALSPMTQSGVIGSINATFRKCFDVMNGRWHSTILDNRTVQWRQNDLSLLESVSEIRLWTNQDELRSFLLSER